MTIWFFVEWLNGCSAIYLLIYLFASLALYLHTHINTFILNAYIHTYSYTNMLTDFQSHIIRLCVALLIMNQKEGEIKISMSRWPENKEMNWYIEYKRLLI